MTADWLPAALRPTAAAWAVRPAIWALLAAAVVAGTGVVIGDRVAVGLAYFGVACAAVFVTSGVYRTRALALLGQGIGAAAGIILGVAVADDDVIVKIAVAAAVAMVSGLVGAIGRLTTAGALMTVIGLGFGEFARVRMPGWEQGLWYLAGTAVVAVCALAGWPVYRDRAAWSAIAAVFDRSADLLQYPDDSTKRGDLAAASALCRTEVHDHRLAGRVMRHSRQDLEAAAGTAEQAALVAAASFASDHATPAPDVVEALRHAAQNCRDRRVPNLPASVSTRAPVARRVRPLPARLGSAARVATTRRALVAGSRLTLCMAIATAVTCALHNESHSFWLPLTVAVAVRPEYGSVYVRTLNRVAGTAAGALLAAAAIAALGSGWPVAIAAAMSLAFAVLAAPKLYGLAVVGVTCSALLSSCIGAADPISPAVRLLDTVIGCAIAIVFGYLIWPRRSSVVSLREPAAAVTAYLRLAVMAPDERHDWTAVRDRAYQLVHQSRQQAQAAVLEPRSARIGADARLSAAFILETLVDEVTAIADRVDAGAPPPTDVEVTELINRIEAAATPPRLGDEAGKAMGVPGLHG